MTLLEGLEAHLSNRRRLKVEGRVSAVRGPILIANLPHTAIGDVCTIRRRDGTSLRAQVVSFSGEEISLAPFDELEGISPGATVLSEGAPCALSLGADLLGSVVDCFGNRLSAEISMSSRASRSMPFIQSPPKALERPPISEILATGVSSIDGLCTLGVGQRVGLFAGAGAGKSTLLGMIARNAEVDLTVIALVGERGREVREFLDDSLGAEGMRRAVAVVSTSDEPPIRRALAIDAATTIAEDFRSRGKRVLLLVDSLTRAARALREVGLAAGELPIRQGYTATVYSKLPRILERAGTTESGSITAIYTVLTNGEGESDPLGEEIRSLLDGHLVLDPKVAERGVRPAVDPVASVSRLMSRLQPQEFCNIAETIRMILARLSRDRDLLMFGGSPDKELAAALAVEAELRAALSQPPSEARPRSETERRLDEIAKKFRSLSQ